MKKTTYFLFVLMIFHQNIFAQKIQEKPIGIVPDSFKKPYGAFAMASMKQTIDSKIAALNLDDVFKDDVEEQKRIRLEYEKQKREMALLEGKGGKASPVSTNLPAGKKIYHKRVTKIVKRRKKKKCNC